MFRNLHNADSRRNCKERLASPFTLWQPHEPDQPQEPSAVYAAHVHGNPDVFFGDIDMFVANEETVEPIIHLTPSELEDLEQQAKRRRVYVAKVILSRKKSFFFLTIFNLIYYDCHIYLHFRTIYILKCVFKYPFKPSKNIFLWSFFNIVIKSSLKKNLHL